MTRDGLIKFLQENYTPDEELLWQTFSFAEAGEPYHDLASPQTWLDFVDNNERYNTIADEISNIVIEGYSTYLEEN
jgi:hypothetical protein